MAALATCVSAALAACVVVACESGSTPRDGGVGDSGTDAAADSGNGSIDAAADALTDATVDASTDGGMPFEECAQYFRDMPWLRVHGDVERTTIEYSITVVESTESALRAQEDPEADPYDEPYVEIEFPLPFGEDIERPSVGDTVILLGGMCDGMLETGYFRILAEDRRLLFEGGSPDCADLQETYPWGPHLGERAQPDAEPCAEELRRGDEVLCCCRTRTEREVILHPDGDSVLVPGEDREVLIDGVRFLASAQGSFAITQAPCEYDRTGIYGSAFVARLADQ